MAETNEPTDAAITAEQSDDFMIEDLEERFVQGKWECACSSSTCDCCSCCLYIF